MQLIENEYFIQGLKVTDIVDEFDAPVFVYDADKIVSQYAALKGAFSGLNIRIKYAVKALSNPAILKLLRKEGAGLDVVSLNEGKLGLEAGYAPREILFTPNSVGFDEIREGVEMGFGVNIDNLEILRQFGETFGNSRPCSIRLNPHILAGGNSKISTGHIDSKFGISIYQLPQVLNVVNKYGMNIHGLHMHTGSDILEAEVFLKMAEILFGVARDFKDLKFIDFGSGFKVAYKQGDITTNVFDLGVKLTEAFKKFCVEYGRDLEVWFEPGKFLVSEAGVFLVKVNVVKNTPARLFAGVNSGLNHLIRPMMYDAYHDIFNVSNPGGDHHVYSVVGYICETDTFGWDRKLTEVRPGDILAIKNAGAYGISMASNYNSRTRPTEVLVYKGTAHMIRRPETFEDIKRNFVDFDIE